MYSLVRGRVPPNFDMENWEEVEQKIRAERPAELQESYNKETDKLIDKLFETTKGARFTLEGVVTLETKVPEGTIVKVVSVTLANVLLQIEEDWTKAYEIPSHKWEEIIAAGYDIAGFDEVILTPRSGDHGRDVIAIKKGFGSIKIINSVKAYKPGHLVRYDDVRALLGVLSGEHDASKGVIITTSDFPPKIEKDPFIAPFMPYRLELMNGDSLKDWMKELLKK